MHCLAGFALWSIMGIGFILMTNVYETSPELKKLLLGKTTNYNSGYRPDLLQGVPRSLNRSELDLNAHNLPFVGYDLWNLYELSWLNPKGKPVVATGVVKIPFDSQNLVESKSFKLYLNSLNQWQFSSVEEVKNTLERDLARCVNKPVFVFLHTDLDNFKDQLGTFDGICIDHLDIEIKNNEFSTKHLENISGSERVTETLYSHLLKSNCLITNQPDWGSVSISYTGKKLNQEKLLRYIISFRNHNEFHEQCVERIYCDLMKFAEIETLCVDARYTRRGGLDINPLRSSTEFQSPCTTRFVRQ